MEFEYLLVQVVDFLCQLYWFAVVHAWVIFISKCIPGGYNIVRHIAPINITYTQLLVKLIQSDQY